MSILKKQQRRSALALGKKRKKAANINVEPISIGIGVSTSALFNVLELGRYYEDMLKKHGEERAKELYRTRIEFYRSNGKTLRLGPAAALIKKFISFDGLAGINIDLRMISRNHPDMGGLVNDSSILYPWLFDAEGLSRIKGGSFTAGAPISAQRVIGHGVDVLLCTNAEDAINLNAAGLSAARLDHINENPKHFENEDALVIGFDFDRVLGLAPHPNDLAKDAEAYYHECVEKHGAHHALQLYSKHMRSVGENAAEFTHLTQFFKKLYEAKERIEKLNTEGKTQKKIIIRIVTARGFDAFPQIAATLEALGTPEVEVDYLSGKPKAPFIHDCDIFFDDIPKNLKGARLGAEIPAEAARQIKRGGPLAPTLGGGNA